MALEGTPATGEPEQGVRIVPFPPPLDFGAYVIGVDVEAVDWTQVRLRQSTRSQTDRLAELRQPGPLSQRRQPAPR